MKLWLRMSGAASARSSRLPPAFGVGDGAGAELDARTGSTGPLICTAACLASCTVSTRSLLVTGWTLDTAASIQVHGLFKEFRTDVFSATAARMSAFPGDGRFCYIHSKKRCN